MKKKTIETILYSTGGIAAMALILIAFNVIAGAFKERVDLTKEKAFTLSQGTKRHPRQAGHAGQNPLLLHARRDRPGDHLS